MEMRAQMDIQAPAEKIWSVITDIDNAADHIGGINKIEILNRPVSGLVGLKWRETRIMFGKEATEVMWITEAETNVAYKTRAESHGAVYLSDFLIEPLGGKCRLSMGFKADSSSCQNHESDIWSDDEKVHLKGCHAGS